MFKAKKQDWLDYWWAVFFLQIRLFTAIIFLHLGEDFFLNTSASSLLDITRHFVDREGGCGEKWFWCGGYGWSV